MKQTKSTISTKKIEELTDEILEDYIEGNIPKPMMKQWIMQKLSLIYEY